MPTNDVISAIPNHVTILIAEDDDGHADLIQELLEEVGFKNPMIRFRDGQETLDYFEGAGAKVKNGQRYLLLLDIRMPRVNGVDVLRQLKANPRWRELPVIMLTTTDDPREIQSCYQNGCNCYITKPVEFGRFAAVLRQLGLFMLVMQCPRVGSGQA